MVVAAYLSGLVIGLAAGWSIRKRVFRDALLYMLKHGILIVDEAKFAELGRKIKL